MNSKLKVLSPGMEMIYDLDLERYVISGVLRHAGVFPDIDLIIDESKDFKNRLHQVIWGVIKRTLLDGERADKVTVSQKINRLSLSFEDKISSVADYLEELSLIPIPADSVLNYAHELKAVSLRRTIADTASKIVDAMHRGKNLKSEEAVALSDSIYTKVVNSFSPKNEPIDLFQGAESYLNTLDNDAPSDEIISPYPNYQKFFGGYFPGDLTLFASPAKSGKSTLIMDMMIQMSQKTDESIKGLIIDTELETYRVQRRMISAISGVNEYLIKSKQFRNNPALRDKVKYALEVIKPYFNKVDHIYVGNVSTEEMVSIAKRWHWKNVRKDKDKALIALDYFKLTMNDKITDAFQSSMSLGYRVDSFKKLASELCCPIIGACQTNAADEVGLSKEVNKFASSVFLFKKKNAEEFLRDGDWSKDGKPHLNAATHKLVPLFTRDLGEYSEGVNDLVKVPDGRGGVTWTENYIEFRLDNFKVKDMGDLRTKHSQLQTMKIGKKIDLKEVSL